MRKIPPTDLVSWRFLQVSKEVVSNVLVDGTRFVVPAGDRVFVSVDDRTGDVVVGMETSGHLGGKDVGHLFYQDLNV